MKQFTVEDMCRSDYAARNGIDNLPLPFQRAHLIDLIENVLIPVQKLIQPSTLVVQSGFRCPELNEAIGGAQRSQHMDGFAVDLTAQGMSLKDLYNTISVNIPFDQLIYEFASWIHVSYVKGGNNRGERLIAIYQTRPDGGSTVMYEKAGVRL